MPLHHPKKSSFGPRNHLVLIRHKVSIIPCTSPSVSTLGQGAAKSTTSCKFRTSNLFVTHKLSKPYLLNGLRAQQKRSHKDGQKAASKEVCHGRWEVSCEAVRKAYIPLTTKLQALWPTLFETTWETKERCVVFNTASGNQQNQFICERTGNTGRTGLHKEAFYEP